MCRSTRSSVSQGFTLIEVVMAITIFSIMMLLSYSVVRNLLESKILLDNNRDAIFIANSVLERISREVQLVATGKVLLPPCGTSGGVPRASFVGEEKSIGAGARGDSITFLAREGGQYVPDGGRHTGIVQIAYRVEPNPEKNGEDGTFLLIRDEMPLKRPATKACEAAIRFPITQNLVSLAFRYFDGNTEQWSTSWSSPGVPAMVEFTITLKAPSGLVNTYTSAVAIKQ